VPFLAGQLLVVWDHSDDLSARIDSTDLPQRSRVGKKELEVIPVRTDDT